MKNIRILGIIAAALLLIIIVVFAAFAFLGTFVAKPLDDEKIPEIAIKPSDGAEFDSLWQTSETSGDITAVIKTEAGDIIIKLADCAAAEKFIELDSSGVFDGAKFKTLAKDMFIQTEICGEGFAAEKTALKNIEGAVGFVLDEKTAFPGIFIITGKDLSSDYEGKTLVFGQVVFGMETVHEIESGENSGYTGGFSAAEPVSISDIEIIYPTEANIGD